MIVSSTGKTVEVALVEDGKLVEIHRQRSTDQFTVGDVFLGKVKRVTAPLNAAFVDIGHKKDAFLHYTDLGPRVRSLQKFAKITRNGKNPTHKLDKFKLKLQPVTR